MALLVRRRLRILVALGVVLTGVSILAMFLVRSGFDGTWFFGTFVALGFFLIFAWLVTVPASPSASPAAHADEETPAGPAAPSPSEPEPELVVQPWRDTPVAVAPVPVAPAPFSTRGFTLYERAGPKGPSRFFSKARPPGAHAIELPQGFEATWDAKRKRLLLVETVPSEPEPELAPEEVSQKPCVAMPAPGEFCENLAEPGARYCRKHAKFRPDEGFVVQLDRRRGSAAKAGGAGGLVEVRLAKPHAKPFRLGTAPEVVVRQDRRQPVRPANKRSASTIAIRRDLAIPAKAGKRTAATTIQVRRPRGEAAKPGPRPKSTTIDVRRDGRTSGGKKFRPREPELVIKRPGLLKPHTLKQTVSRVEVVQGASKKTKPLRTQEPEILVVQDTKRRSLYGVGEAKTAAARRLPGSKA